MPQPKPPATRNIIVRELVKITSGKTNKNVEYTIWQVRATHPDGRPIPIENLRTFEDLPRNEVIQVSIEKFESAQYGVSYTLKQVGRKSAREEISELRERVKKLEEIVYRQAPPPPPTPAPAVPPTTPPPLPATHGLPSDNDIPW